MMAKLLDAVARGTAMFEVKPPPGSLGTPEGGTAAIGVGVGARAGGGSNTSTATGSGSGSVGVAAGTPTAGSAPAPSPTTGVPSDVDAACTTTAPRADGVASSTGGASPLQVGRPGGGTVEAGLSGGGSTMAAAAGVVSIAGTTGRVDSGGGGDNETRGGPSSAGGGQQQEGVICRTSRYRASKSIDGDILSTVVAEARARGAGTGGGAGASGGDSPSPAAGKDGRDVHGPEMEWGLASTGGAGGSGEEEGASDGSAGPSIAALVLRALQDAKEEGMRLPELRRVALRAAGASADGRQADDLQAVMGRVLRSSAVVCVCDAEDVRLVAEARRGTREWGSIRKVAMRFRSGSKRSAFADCRRRVDGFTTPQQLTLLLKGVLSCVTRGFFSPLEQCTHARVTAVYRMH